MLIPLFNVVWHFILVIRVSKSLHNEFARRSIPDAETEHGKRIGLAMCTLVVAGSVSANISDDPFNTLDAATVVCLLCMLAAFACWIVYWRKIAACSRALRADTEDGGLSRSGVGPIPAKRVWWWAAFVAVEGCFALAAAWKDASPKGIALSIPSFLIMLAICSWWYSQSKLLRRRAFPVRLFGYLLFGLGTVGAVVWGVLLAISPLPHPAGEALAVGACMGACAAMIAGSYFLVFQKGSVSARPLQ
jgi:hypothetical protein